MYIYAQTHQTVHIKYAPGGFFLYTNYTSVKLGVGEAHQYSNEQQ